MNGLPENMLANSLDFKCRTNDDTSYLDPTDSSIAHCGYMYEFYSPTVKNDDRIEYCIDNIFNFPNWKSFSAFGTDITTIPQSILNDNLLSIVNPFKPDYINNDRFRTVYRLRAIQIQVNGQPEYTHNNVGSSNGVQLEEHIDYNGLFSLIESVPTYTSRQGNFKLNVVPYLPDITYYTFNLSYSFISSSDLDATYIFGINGNNMVVSVVDKNDTTKKNLLVNTNNSKVSLSPNYACRVNMDSNIIYPLFNFPENNTTHNLTFDNIFDVSTQTTFDTYGVLLYNISDAIKSRIENEPIPEIDSTTVTQSYYLLTSPTKTNPKTGGYQVTEYVVDNNNNAYVGGYINNANGTGPSLLFTPM